MTDAPPAPGRSPVVALVLGWIVPGGGHAYSGHWGKAALFFFAITGLLAAGMVMGHGTNLLPDRLWIAAQVCAGGPAVALIPVSKHIAATSGVDWADRLHETGTLYTAIAGFLNLLVMMDAYIRLAYPDRFAEEEEEAA